jgi:ABC-2 type transport system permease protein
MKPILASTLLQLQSARTNPEHLLILVTAPFFTVIFVSQAQYFGNAVNATNAVVAPGLIGLWFVSVDHAGGMIGGERWHGRLELILASPTRLSAVVFGRVVAIVAIGSLTFAESWLVARFGFDADVTIRRPGLFAIALLTTCFAMAATSVLLSAVFVISRAASAMQNSLSYPFYVLGGVMVPVALLPDWLHPVSHLVFLSWGADVLRAGVSGAEMADWPLSLLAVLTLGVVALVAGVMLTERVVRTLRRNGTMNFA